MMGNNVTDELSNIANSLFVKAIIDKNADSLEESTPIQATRDFSKTKYPDVINAIFSDNSTTFSNEEVGEINSLNLVKRRVVGVRIESDQHIASETLSERENSPFISARSLFESKGEEIPSLVEPYFPKVGIVSVVGSSDTGKSTFLRQLAFAIAYGDNTFLGFKINATYNRAIYISTEDDEHSIKKLLKIQFGMPEQMERTERLKFIFESENLIEKIKSEIEKEPVDLIVIDAFADLFFGDLNANNRVRTFLNEYRELALKNKCLIIFLHHTGKRTENEAPSKNNAIGSQGFEAKMRLMIEIRKDQNDANIRHLCIVKGNYLPEECKTHSIVTRFSDKMLFENLNYSVPFEQLVKKAYCSNDNSAKERALQLRNDQNLTIRKISDQLKTEGFNFGKSAVGEWIKSER